MPPTITDDPAVSALASSALVHIDSGLTSIRAVTFSADGQYILSGGQEGVGIWRLSDGAKVARLQAEHVRCLAVSPDGRWIAAGTFPALIVWDATTLERVFGNPEPFVNAVEFSPDSTHLVAGSLNRNVRLWDVQRRQPVVGPLGHDDIVIAARYSPQGSHIAIATPNSLYVYNSEGTLVVGPVALKTLPWFNNALRWESNDRLIVASDSTLCYVGASTGSTVSSIPTTDNTKESTCIALPRHGQFVVHATLRTLTVWDAVTHAQLTCIQHPQNIRSVARSPDDRLLVVAGEHGKIIVYDTTAITESIPLPRLHPTFLEPDLQLDDTVLDLWTRGQLGHAEALLTTAITSSQNPNHHALAGRALVRVRLKDWDAALCDAEQSLTLRPTVAGYIAKSMALVGKGEKYDGYRACDSAFERFHSTHVSFILLIKAVIAFIAGDRMDAISRVDELIGMVKFNSICYVVQACMHLLLGNSRMTTGDYEHAIERFQQARAQMQRHASRPLFMISLISGWTFDDLGTTIRNQLFEALYAAGRSEEACESLLEMQRFVEQEAHVGEGTTLLSEFMQRCLTGPVNNLSAPLLVEWVKLKLDSESWKDAVAATANFTPTKFTVYRVICERLEVLDQLMDALECFSQMKRELGTEADLPPEEAQWITELERRFAKTYERRGDESASAQRYEVAISEYSAALSLRPALPQKLYVKRSEMYVEQGALNDALEDAEKAIELDSSSPWGYERKHAVLHKEGEYGLAINALKTMLSKMDNSTDPETRNRRNDYVRPSETIMAVRMAVQHATRDLPRVLINTESGRLCARSDQTKSFESQPIFEELVSSMTRSIDLSRIEEEVKQYYRYATFSHKWEEHEPLFERVVHIVVYDLEKSPTHHKLQMFCRIVRDAGLRWAWSDTCCINKGDHVVIQEALVSMFKWYEGSTVTIVHLCDVHSTGQPGDLVKSVWNSRGWTFQEYHASQVVQFYTNDWKLYLNLDVPNHKLAPEIISEMEKATRVPAQTLMSLQPGQEDIRDKLCLASGRKTTYIEDSAYSLLGIFNMSLPVTYGDRDKALGKLLAHLLTTSGDASILAWSGASGSYNSCLPESITVFGQPPTTHIPQAISHTEMEKEILGIRSLPFEHADRLYKKLRDLPTPGFADRRMRLPCIKFQLGPLLPSQNTSQHGYRARASQLGVVEIHTKEDLSRCGPLYVVHPWIDHLLDPHTSAVETTTPEGSTDGYSDTSVSPPGPSRAWTTQSRRSHLVQRLTMPLRGRTTTGASLLPPDTASVLPPTLPSAEEHRTRVLQCMVRLKAPFGALLLTPKRAGNTRDFKRVAADCQMTVRVLEWVQLKALVECVGVVEVL